MDSMNRSCVNWHWHQNKSYVYDISRGQWITEPQAADSNLNEPTERSNCHSETVKLWTKNQRKVSYWVLMCNISDFKGQASKFFNHF